MKLTTTVALLKSAFADDGNNFSVERSVAIENIERTVCWVEKKSGGNASVPLAHVASMEGVVFALWALRAAEQQADACRIGRLLAIDMATEALALLKEVCPDLAVYERHLASIRETVLAGGDLQCYRDLVRLLSSIEEGGSSDLDDLESDVRWAFASSVRYAFSGGGDYIDPEGDWPLGGLWSAYDAFDTLRYLMQFTDPRYITARRIASLAYAAEKRWQRGTRLDFCFTGEIQGVIDDLESELDLYCMNRAVAITAPLWKLHIEC